MGSRLMSSFLLISVCVFHLTQCDGVAVGGHSDVTETNLGNLKSVKENMSDRMANYFRTRRSTSKKSSPKNTSFSAIQKMHAEWTKMARDAAMTNESNPTEQTNQTRLDPIYRLHQQNIKEKQDDSVYSGVSCSFENDCKWTWRKDIANGFYITSGAQFKSNDSGPKVDANGRPYGSFLFIRLPINSREFHVTSPLFGPTTAACKLRVHVFQEYMDGGEIRIVGDKTNDESFSNHTQWLVDKIHGEHSGGWKKHEMSLGKITSNFTIILEVVPSENTASGAIVAFDNLQLYQCFVKNDDTCTRLQYRCNTTMECVNTSSVCDFTEDCPLGDDETQNCHLMPYGSRCSFEEEGWCGWTNIVDSKTVLQWARHNGSSPSNFTGPRADHTFMNTTGSYLYVSMLKDGSQFASGALLQSVTFNPPPRVHGNSSSRYYNSCAIRFYLHKTGKHKSGILLEVIELTPTENKTTNLYWSYVDDHGDQWVRVVLILPNITHRYFLNFMAKKGYRYLSDLAIDDVSLSPECFGLNIPADELQGYNYWNPRSDVLVPKEPHPDFKNKTFYMITNCKATGRFGPTQHECLRAYNNTKVSVKVLHEPGLTGVQKWVVPRNGFYTFILAGASGGKGSSTAGSSRGAMVRTVMELKKGQEMYILVGQEGSSACPKVLGQTTNSSCSSNRDEPISGGVRGVLQLQINDSGGGGGGATFLFIRNKTKDKVPVAVAAGGGGLGMSRFFLDNEAHHGQAINMSVLPGSGAVWSFKSAGAGGGWTSTTPGGLANLVPKQMMGSSLQAGGIGGKACYNSTDGRGDGGFGGGGGGCKSGGGGGGYRGGDANSTNGGGGISFLDPTKGIPSLSEAHSGYNVGEGYVVIIPAVEEGCGCNYLCVSLDEKRSSVVCLCPPTWKLANDEQTCIPLLTQRESNYPPWFVVGLIVTVVCLTVAFGVVCFVLYNRYQQRASGLLRRKMLSGPDLQLDRLRMASDGMMTEYNPNYEFGGIVYTLKDLKDIPREQLRLLKALGQGAFGEVYQGFYRQRPCDTVEMPVAVKTLPEMSTSQAEMDFLMEALIMSKFNHPNIVHFIGVCFDKHPRFIVLELLAGGDLKNFLRESRPKPERASPLSMKDLVLIAIDVAKGCKYLEENRFIHRDIAARNCLLTTKGPGRVVKIADFGMSRDVYRSDYYRKGGKAMLPIKWMPPEAFLDGIFTSKTDVWSFGVLLWEIMKMGFMPYTGCTNREVMDLVVQGGRLEQPENCPGPVYGVMTQCWHPKPEHRPSFSTILERLGYCAQDPDVMNAPLPVFHRAPSNERDATLMRPSDSEENCLQVVPNPSDYLVPNHTAPATPDPIESTSSVEKLLPDGSDNWETSFIMPSSRSTQPLLLDNAKDEENQRTSADNQNSKGQPSFVPNSIQHNNNFMVKNEGASVKSGVSLDAAALAKAVMTPNQAKKYANVNASDVPVSNGLIQSHNFSVGNHLPKNDTEINC
ncbi:tyrosine-protein kinase receptor [Cylas formicarius]|uniref:tyrosine-protein kinase receptor n=1 Tax=Cylas formicarius TaxID=197179 RepID=UPI0029587AB4|nr:tyrosine-protein kinase receptor [Cylas formicarius]